MRFPVQVSRAIDLRMSFERNEIERCYFAVSHAYDDGQLTVMGTRSSIEATLIVTLLILMLLLTIMKMRIGQS